MQKTEAMYASFECGPCHHLLLKWINTWDISAQFICFPMTNNVEFTRSFLPLVLAYKTIRENFTLKVKTKHGEVQLSLSRKFCIKKISYQFAFTDFWEISGGDHVDHFAFFLDNKHHMKTLFVEQFPDKGPSRVALCVQVQHVKPLD